MLCCELTGSFRMLIVRVLLDDSGLLTYYLPLVSRCRVLVYIIGREVWGRSYGWIRSKTGR